MKSETKTPADYMSPLSINKLHGRVLHMPSTKKTKQREILLLYGHHSSLERMFAFVENLADYGNVTLPDWPGFGGMDSFYKIGKEPSVDNMADYLATFIKLNYKKKRFTIVGFSWGFIVTTRMLQKYPELVPQVNLLVSLAGFIHRTDFKVPARTQFFGRIGSRAFSGAIGSTFVRYTALQPAAIKFIYRAQSKTHPKMKGANKEELKRRLDFEVVLWQCNDIRTWMATTNTMLTLDLTGIKVSMPVIHISVDNDQYFNNSNVENHLKKVFSDVKSIRASLPNHAPTIIDNKKEVASLFPAGLRKLLSQKP